MPNTTYLPFRFGVNFLELGDGPGWTAKCVTAERLGYDVILVADHLGMPAPFPALVAAAGVTTRPRLGTFVLNAAFHRPTLLAREVATTDQLIGGRLELGLGTGYVEAEFTAAGLPYGSGRDRLDHLTATVDQLGELLGDPAHRPTPAQSPVPLLLGGNGNRMLRLAARTADIISFTGATTDPSGRPVLSGPEDLDERVRFARDAAGDRAAAIESNVLVMTVAVTDTDRAAAESSARLHAEVAPNLDRASFDELPTVLIGTPERIVAKLLRSRERYGFSYVTVLEPVLNSFGDVVRLMRERGEIQS